MAQQGNGAPPSDQRQLTLDQAMQLAAQHQNAGQLQQAETILQKILAVQARHAPALHLLGVIAYQVGKSELAVKLIGQAIEIDPKQSLYHSNRGEMCRLLGRVEEARVHGEQAVALDPSSPAAHSNYGLALYDLKDYDRAEQCQRRALELAPQFGKPHNNLGSILRERKDLEGAMVEFRKAMELEPSYHEPYNNLGAVLLEAERHEEALPHLQRAIQLKGDYAEAHCNLACCLRQEEKFDLALAHFANALACRPVYPEASLGIAGIRLETEQSEEALVVTKRALETSPDHAELHAMLGSIQNDSGYAQEAEAAFSQALELDPELISAHNGRGGMAMERGESEAAQAHYRKALAIDPKKTDSLFHLALAKKFEPDDPDIKPFEALLEDYGSLSGKRAMQLNFALGKICDDTKDYDRAFKYYQEGCRLKRARIAYSSQENADLVRRIRETFTPRYIEAMGAAGTPSQLPIFVLGMPRSGTTLTEQIIASHADAYGAGELRDLVQVASDAAGPQGVGFPANCAALTLESFRQIGERYVDGLAKRAPDARRITDKMPANYLMIGLIHIALPQAKIVHLRRHPLDTCLSNFNRLFSKNQFQSYDLVELGEYYRQYRGIMAHWREVLPPGSFYELDYETLVDDTEAQARNLLDFLELDWDPACLAFHQSKRQIKTASLTQVRQPVYRTSIERWRRYEKHIKPLIEALGDCLDSEERSS